MAQTGYTPILIYSSSTAAQAPAAANLANSTLGSELAINITDGKLFYKDNANAVQVIGWKVVPTTAGGTGLTSYTAGDLVYYASGTTFTKLAIGSAGRYLASSGSAPQWNAPAALTKTDDTNVTLTLGGSASTALLNAASLTLGWTGQLAVTRGGTGLSTVAQGDILYASAADTLARLAKNTTATRYLANTGTSNNPDWAQVNLANGVTGTLPTGNGGTGLSSFSSGGIVYANSTTALATSSSFTWSSSGGVSTSNSTAGFFTQLTNGSITLREAGNSTANNTMEVHIRPSSGKSGYVTFTEDAIDDVYAIGFAAGSQNLLFKRGSIAGTTYLTLSGVGNLYTSSGTTSMTNGFIYIPSAAGVPSGTPTSVSGRVPMYYDTTNNRFYIYNGAWKYVALI